jgi:ferrous iron transport protein B
MKLVELKTNESGYISRIRGSGTARQRILEMGLTKGEAITVLRNAPLMDPISCMILNQTIQLRRSEAELVDIVTDRELSEFQSNGYRSNPLRAQENPGSAGIHVAMIGAPNSGKTSLYNTLSKSQEHVGNYSGVTLDLMEASLGYKGHQITITDFPGILSFSDLSENELMIRNFIAEGHPDIILHVVDANHIERDLQLTAELVEMSTQVIVALNMYDEFTRAGNKFNFSGLSKMMGIPIIPTVANKGQGAREILDAILNLSAGTNDHSRHIQINYGPEIEQSIQEVQDLMNAHAGDALEISARFSAIKLLEGDPKMVNALSHLETYETIHENIERHRNRLRRLLKEEPDVLLKDARYGFVSGALKETLVKNPVRERTDSELIDTVVTHKVFGLPILLMVLFIAFYATFEIGQYPMQWLESLITLLSDALSRSVTPGPLTNLIIDGVIGGVGSVLVFLPNILILFYFISLMEDTGYMARAAFIMDNLMHRIGLHGRSFIPLVMGFGCNVPAIMASRAVKNKNNRLLTMLINPFMSCSARLPVYILVIGAFFPDQPGLVLFMMYTLGIVVAAITAILFKKTIFREEEVPYVLELPPYRVPAFKATLRHMWGKGSEYLKKMGGIILVASIIIWGLGYYPTGDESGNARPSTNVHPSSGGASNALPVMEDASNTASTTGQVSKLENSYIGRIGRFIEPVMRPLGFDWKMSVSILTGIAAKEVVVSTMGVLYHANQDGGPVETLTQRIKNERYSDGKKSGQNVFNPVVGLSFMVFILLYFPCIATIAAIRKESGTWRWAIFSILYSTALAWIMSFIIYQVGSLFI